MPASSRLSFLLFLSIGLLAVGNLSCSRKPSTLFELQADTGIDFVNTVEDGKLENSFLFRNFYNGGGVAIGDINNDGLADIFFTSNMGENKLYLNKGGFHFEDVTAKCGFRQDSMWSTGVTFVDINNDGWLDIYVCNSGHMVNGNRRNKLYINNHDLTFTESAAKYGLDHRGYTTQVSFFDYDLDGDLDCFIIDNSPIPVNQLRFDPQRELPEAQWHVPDVMKGGGNHLLRNDNGFFHEVTQQAGIHGSLISFGLGISVGDVNNDGWPDIYVSNDSYERDYLYINQKNGTFKDEFEDRVRHTSFSSMGADLADINNDGYPDIFNTDMLPDDDYRLKTTGAFDNIDLFRTKLKAGFYYQYVKNCLQLNNSSGKFMETGNYSGISASDWSWGALMFDMDNDGFNDIYVCNGVNRDVTNLDFIEFFSNDVNHRMVLTGKKENVDAILAHVPRTPLLNKAYRNLGNLGFQEMAKQWGFTQATWSNGAAYGDLDNDGDLDLVINNENSKSFVYRNNSREINHNHFLGVKLVGPEKNGFAIGSKIYVHRGKDIILRELYPSRGFQSSVDYKQIVGLGGRKDIDSLVIVWPDMSRISISKPPVDTVLVIRQGAAVSTPVKEDSRVFTASSPATPLLQPVKAPFEKHTEDDYTDFYYERDIPRLLSREGPRAAVADVNGDGLEDVFIGGTKGHAGQLYLQRRDGSFEKSAQPGIGQFKDFEDIAVTFIDYDKDGHPDLLVCPGGNADASNTRQMQLRMFRNDGKGGFKIDANVFPNTGMNISVAIPEDFNGDGYPDLFVGGRNDPHNYGMDATSYLFLNDGKGHFIDIAPKKAPTISHIGMVTGAVWADITGDARKELVIVGEWMPPRAFSFEGDNVKEVPTNLGNKYGWWQTISAADVDGDGRTDLIIGNIGMNFYFHPDKTHPVKLWIADFDKNNSPDRVITSTVNGKDLPVFLKHDMEEQVPALRKHNLKHEDYASKSIQELFPKETMQNCIQKQFNFEASIVALNKGNGQFAVEELPAVVQLSSLNAIRCTDLNGDGKIDLVLGGNEFGFIPQFERLDASYGTVMINAGQGRFRVLDAAASGLDLNGQVRDIREIRGAKGQQYFLFLRNDELPLLFQRRPQ